MTIKKKLGLTLLSILLASPVIAEDKNLKMPSPVKRTTSLEQMKKISYEKMMETGELSLVYFNHNKDKWYDEFLETQIDGSLDLTTLIRLKDGRIVKSIRTRYVGNKGVTNKHPSYRRIEEISLTHNRTERFLDIFYFKGVWRAKSTQNFIYDDKNRVVKYLRHHSYMIAEGKVNTTSQEIIYSYDDKGIKSVKKINTKRNMSFPSENCKKWFDGVFDKVPYLSKCVLNEARSNLTELAIAAKKKPK